MYLQGGSNELDIDSEACAVPSDIFEMGLIAKWSNSLVVKALASQSRGPVFKPLGGSKVDSAFYTSKGDQMSTKNFWELSGKK